MTSRESTGQGGPTAVHFLNLRSVRRILMTISLLCGLSSSSQADPLINFAVTDLGPGTPTFADGANGGVVIAGNGLTAYPFQRAQDTSLDPQQLLSSGFPLFKQAPTWDPDTYGNPANAYSMLTSTMKNSNGIIVGIDDSGVDGHYGSTDVYSINQGPSGGWGPATYMWSGGSTRSEFGEPVATITGINALNEVLGSGLGQGYPAAYSPQAFLYNLNTNSLLDLNTLSAIQAGGWNSISPIAIDDQGRILLTVSPLTGPDHTLLLTPEGVSSNPLAVPAPEPAPLALAVVTIAALALRRAVRGRRPHGSA